MALLHEELYEALKSAGADDQKARDAARGIGSLKSDMRLVKWMVGVNSAGILLIFATLLYIVKLLGALT